ncbi:MAG TPA: FG-GAP-like repeat-containing protein [Puia sp.]|uniref:FG-GAP-like repeat-containing protein n=1 Tax=Puia sp. TaxID=2045100 RepID=UPI002C5612BB|nr:FG-GAP-like repeat-containing protein [Puia sp.]HVU99542.1 FG-GAP-like repeat-containing protein [Puia sp.]
MKQLLFSFLTFGVLTGVTAQSASPAIPGAFALTGVTIIDANHPSGATKQTVVVRDGIIAAVYPDGSVSLSDSVRRIAMTGKYLLPGLIDTHVHMATDPSGTDNRAATLAVLDRMLRSGITIVRDMAGDARTLAGLSRDAFVGDIVSPDLYYSALMAGPSFFDDPRSIATAQGGKAGAMPYMLGVTNATDLDEAMAEAKGTGATGIKLYADIDAALVRKIVDAAHRQGLLVWGHAWLDPARPSDMVNAGVGSISHSPLLVREKFARIPASWKKRGLRPNFWKDSLPDLSELFDAMKAHGTILDATMSAYHQWAQRDPEMEYSYAIAKYYTAAAYRAGVLICAGTDDDQEEFVQSEMGLLVHDAGLTPADAIVAATSTAARALGMDRKCGTIEKGKWANLLVVDNNPLTAIENIRKVILVVKRGSIVGETVKVGGIEMALDRRFVKHVLTRDFISEGAAIADVNGDGKPDILAGAYWFEAPGWTRHALTEAKQYDPTTQFSNSFLNYSLDVNQDGWPDLIRISLPGEEAVWYENPGKKPGYWPMHFLLSHCGNESPAFVDVDGDGRPDLLCNDPIAKEVIWLKPPVRKGDSVWTRHVIASGAGTPGVNRYTHGMGLIDMNGDGRKDVVVTKGWWERPADVMQSGWVFHPAGLGEDCAQIYPLDVRGDGRMALVSSSAHRYGIWWHEKTDTGWVHHPIFSGVSETHALTLADVNGDGHPDLVTGKRYFAHNGEDPGAYEPSLLYWFEFHPGVSPSWTPHLVDMDSGVGLQVLVQDIDGNGLPDIIVANKKGVFFFEQVRR